MAAGMRVMGLLVAILAMGTPSVFAHRALLQGGFPGFNAFVNPPVGQTITLFEAPGLKITSRTDGPIGGIPTPKFPWLNPPATLTSTREFLSKFPSTKVPALGGFTFPGFNLPPFPFFGNPPAFSPGSPPTSASAPSPVSSAPSPSPRASTPSPHSSPSSPPPRASAPPTHSSASSPASPPKN